MAFVEKKVGDPMGRTVATPFATLLLPTFGRPPDAARRWHQDLSMMGNTLHPVHSVHQSYKLNRKR